MSEARGWFPSTVPVLDGKLGVIRNVSNANEAADVLLHRWPPNPGKSHLAARRAVLEALERYRDQTALKKARDAFRKAAKDADILAEYRIVVQ